MAIYKYKCNYEGCSIGVFYEGLYCAQHKAKVAESKKCGKCLKVKPISEYSVAKSTGLVNSYCKKCTADWVREKNYRKPEVKERKHKLVKEWYKDNRDKVYKAARLRRNPYEDKARSAVVNAVKLGKFAKQPCQVCGELRVDFHHSNGYDKDSWFTGMWLCRKHHAAEHVRLRDIKRAREAS